MINNTRKQESVNSDQRVTHHSSFITHHSPKGFTLIETLVAISVLLLSLAGPMSIASQSLQSAYYARDQITAFYLAQEAVEYVRAVRDQNYLAGASWLTGIENCLDTECVIDFPNFTHELCSGPSGCAPVRVGDTTGLFNQTSGTVTPYTRVLRIQTVPGTSDEVTVRVSVSWQSGRLERQFEIHEQLFNWL